MRQKIYNAARFYMRLKTEIWVQALIMRASVGGAMATVLNRGDKDAGDCLVRVNNLDGSSSLFSPILGPEGQRIWQERVESGTDNQTIDTLIEQDLRIDPDLWVVEIEDRLGRHFLEETVKKFR